MLYKLQYTNEYGQIVDSCGELEVNVAPSKSYVEEYDDLEKAKFAAKGFVDKNPLMACVISSDDNGEEIIISADKSKIDIALENKKALDKSVFMKANRDRKIKISILLIIILLIGLTVFIVSGS